MFDRLNYQYCSCSYCDGTGLIDAYHRLSKNRYSFKCCCESGKQHHYEYPVWNPAIHTKRFMLIDELLKLEKSKLSA